jgi:3'(2'), 5'-bisphosphate nucleotidase
LIIERQEFPQLVDEIALLCRRAGDAILEIYNGGDIAIETKKDDSPLTAADLASHNILVEGLASLSVVPVLSEESDLTDYADRQQWQQYFLIDPLDGTKEFISRNGEFTVNVALIENGRPVAGIVYAPVNDVLYGGVVGEQALAFVERAQQRTPISTRLLDPQQPLAVVASRRHGGDALQGMMSAIEQRFAGVELINMGSSLKFCLVAEGQADFYPRLAPTSEWDTGAAQAVVEAAGGQVVGLDFKPLGYNQKAEILNPHFLVLGDPNFDWQGVLPVDS